MTATSRPLQQRFVGDHVDTVGDNREWSGIKLSRQIRWQNNGRWNSGDNGDDDDDDDDGFNDNDLDNATESCTSLDRHQ